MNCARWSEIDRERPAIPRGCDLNSWLHCRYLPFTIMTTPPPDQVTQLVSELEQLGISRPVALSALEVRLSDAELRSADAD